MGTSWFLLFAGQPRSGVLPRNASTNLCGPWWTWFGGEGVLLGIAIEVIIIGTPFPTSPLNPRWSFACCWVAGFACCKEFRHIPGNPSVYPNPSSMLTGISAMACLAGISSTSRNLPRGSFGFSATMDSGRSMEDGSSCPKASNPWRTPRFSDPRSMAGGIYGSAGPDRSMDSSRRPTGDTERPVARDRTWCVMGRAGFGGERVRLSRGDVEP